MSSFCIVSILAVNMALERPRGESSGDVTPCDPGDCLVCLVAHTTGVHFAQNAASSSSSDASGGSGGRNSFHPNAHSLVYRPTARLKIFLSCELLLHKLRG